MPLDPQDVRESALCWHELTGASARLINHSENHTFLFEGPAGRFTLRVHRPGYQDDKTVQSELTWLAALQRDTDVPVTRPVPGANGQVLQHFITQSGEHRHAVLFHYVHGIEPDMSRDLTSLFAMLGSYAAKLHQHVTAWSRPPGFTRQAWDAGSILSPDGLWGNWRTAPGVDSTNRLLIERATQRLRRDLHTYGTEADRYGLIHADMRLGNLLVDGGKVSLIDFDDAGFCWFTYDFAASISFYETHPAVPALMAAWLQTYQTIRRLTPADIASLDTMILLRRLALLAWIGSHAETRLAQTHMAGFAEGTANLAERYLVARP